MSDVSDFPDLSLGGKWDAMLDALKKARYHLMLIEPEKRAVAVSNAIGIMGRAIAHAEASDKEQYVAAICAKEDWPPERPTLSRDKVK